MKLNIDLEINDSNIINATITETNKKVTLTLSDIDINSQLEDRGYNIVPDERLKHIVLSEIASNLITSPLQAVIQKSLAS